MATNFGQNNVSKDGGTGNGKALSLCRGEPFNRQPGGLQAKCYIGIDNGFTGAIVLLTPDDQIVCRPVVVLDLGKEKLLDVAPNVTMLRELTDIAASYDCGVHIVFEQSPIAPIFGVKNNYTNGKNNEFWRVILTLGKLPFSWINAQKWQKELFAGIRGDDTKAMAALVCRQQLPALDVSAYKRSQTEGIHDALCIALWARRHRL